MSELPKGWVQVALDNLVQPKSERVSPLDNPQAQYVGLEHVEAHTNVILTTIPAASMASSSVAFVAGDVLYGRMRPYLNKVVRPNFSGLASAEFIVFPESAALDSDFLLMRISATDFVQFACSQYEGDRPRVKFDQMGKFLLNLPPRAEQTSIVTKLQELLSDLDAGVAELKAAQKKLQQFRQSLLKAASEGALTASWRKAQRAANTPLETGAQLLERILRERRALWEEKQLAKFKEQGKSPPKDWQQKYPEPVAPDIIGLPALPEGWVWSSLDALISDGPQNGLYLPAERYGQGTPILRIDDFQIGWNRGRADLKCVDAGEQELLVYSLRAGDLVINRVNSMTHLGKSLLIPESLSGALYESNMMRLSLSGSVSGEFVEYYLGSAIGRARLTQDAKWAVNQASINQQDVRRTPVPLPPLTEQFAIAELLVAQMATALSLDDAIVLGSKQSNAQRQNILRAAFAGQLVPQDPNDEPASVLLERIRSGRTTQAATNKPRGRKKERAAA